jgi:hypothetical protein
MLCDNKIMRKLIKRYWKCCILLWLFPGLFTVVAPTFTIRKFYFSYPVITWCLFLIFMVSLSIYAGIVGARVMPLLKDTQIDFVNRMTILIFPTIFMALVGLVIGVALKHFVESIGV